MHEGTSGKSWPSLTPMWHSLFLPNSCCVSPSMIQYLSGLRKVPRSSSSCSSSILSKKWPRKKMSSHHLRDFWGLCYGSTLYKFWLLCWRFLQMKLLHGRQLIPMIISLQYLSFFSFIYNPNAICYTSTAPCRWSHLHTLRPSIPPFIRVFFFFLLLK